MARQRSNAKARGIEWKLTFDEWCSLWEGKAHLRGRGSDDLCMCRYGDTGAYEIGNVFIGTGLDNRREQQKRRYKEFRDKHNIEQFIKDRLSGLTYKQLRDKYGISEGTVGNFIKEFINESNTNTTTRPINQSLQDGSNRSST